MLKAIRSAWKRRQQFVSLLVGVPHYETYVEHMKTFHAGEPIMTREEFFREAQERRYNGKGGKVSRCC